MCKKLIFLISFVLVLVSASGLARAANEIWREAESADVLTAPMAMFSDDPLASGGKYIGATAGNNSTAASPAPAGTASYIFDVPATGTYKVVVRIKLATDTVDDDSSYARIDGATYSSGSGWIKWNNNTVKAGTAWQWVTIFNNDASDADVNFTMAAGQYTLEIAYREDGMYFDGILITDNLALDVSTLPAVLPAGGGSACTEPANLLTNGGFEDGFTAPWVFDNATPAYVIVDDAEQGEKALKVTVAAKGASEYIPALAHPGLSFKTGKKYTFSVFLKGSANGMRVYLKPQQRGGAYTGYGAAYVTLTTEWVEYSVTTPVFTSDVATADVSIWLGIQAGDVYIDHARFYEGDYAAPCAPVGPTCTEPANILTNGSFEDGFTAPWVFDNATPAYVIVDDAEQGEKALKVTVAAKGASEYIPALAHPGLSFVTGKKYTFSVFLKGSANGMRVYMKPQQRGGAYTGYGADYKTLTTEWVEYSVTTPVFTSDVATADVSIWLGIQAGVVYIDHVRFYEGDYVAPCPPAVKPAVVKATKANPADGTTNLPRANLLSWKAGDYADSHNVYLGTNQQAVTDATVEIPMGVLVSLQQPDASYDAIGDYGTTYYWRVDEVNEADMTITKGNVWSFATKAIGLIIPQASITATASSSKDDTQGPINTINGSGLTGNQHSTDSKAMWLSASTTAPDQAWIQYNFDKVYKLPQMLVWNYNVSGLSGGMSIKGVTIEYSADGGQTWKALPNVNELPKGLGANGYGPIIVDLGGVANGIAADAIRITANSNWSTTPKFNQYGLSEVKFYYIPVWPTTPSPADNATGISVLPTLTWSAGEGVVEHKVFLGTNEQAVIDGTAASYTVSTPSLKTPELALESTYFWRVEEVNMASDPNAWSGDTWSFSVSPYRVVDDFEGSSLKWSGGSSSSGNGAAVILDTALANNGSKSMKFMYDNRSTQGYSETTATVSGLTSGTNWKSGGPNWLVFWIYGDVANVNTESLYVKLNNSAVYWYSKPLVPISEVLTPWWTQVTVPLQSDVVTLNNVTNIGIGFIRNSNVGKAATGVIHVDDIRLYKNAPVPTVPVNPGDANLIARYKMENNVNDSSSHGLNGTIIGNPAFVSGPYSAFGKALAFDANQDCVDLGNKAAFNPAGSFSVSLWANITSWTSSWGNVMVGNRGEGTVGWQIRRGSGFGTNGNSVVFTTRGISNDDFYSNVTPPLNTWVYITCVYDSVAFTKAIYFNGKLIRKINLTGTNHVIGPTTHNTYIGARANSANSGQESLFNGSLDDVRLYNKALTDAEIRFLADPTP